MMLSVETLQICQGLLGVYGLQVGDPEFAKKAQQLQTAKEELEAALALANAEEQSSSQNGSKPIEGVPAD